MKYLSYFAFAAMVLSSCGKKTEDVTCQSGVINLLMAGFSADYAYAHIDKYHSSATYDTLLATYPLPHNNYYIGDTSIVPFDENMVQPGYSYHITFPALGTSYVISDFTPSGQTHKLFTYTKGFSHPPFECYNAIVSCIINGVVQMSQPVAHEERTRLIYIHKP